MIVGAIAILIYSYGIYKQIHNYIKFGGKDGAGKYRRSFIAGYTVLTFWTICIYMGWETAEYYCSLFLAINGFIFFSNSDLKYLVMGPINLVKRFINRLDQ